MPHAASFRLSWLNQDQVYELSTSTCEEIVCLTSEEASWFAWLEKASSFAFHGQQGSFTARKETKQRGSVYWYAYRKHEGALVKKYLGKAADLTFTRLEEIASLLQGDSVPVASLPEPRRSQVAQPETGEALARPDRTQGAAALVFPPPGAPPTPGNALAPLLATKLHLPRPRPRLVPRARLVERLQQGVTGPLTLVSAPAGSGKTTLLAQWQASTRTPVAWLWLEPEDNEPMRFLTYLIAALQTRAPHLGARARTLLRFPQPVDPALVLAELSNDLLAWQGEDMVLVLDDVHVITDPSLHHLLIRLIEHLPPRLHLILATRSDPPLPLARWRANGALTELHMAELRFNTEEAGTFLEQVMHLYLSPEDITTVQSRTEGWVAGLQLAALALSGRTDVASALTAFTGTHRFVLDYLSEEVLSRQPASVQAFLLQTSILERLSGSLCDAVTGDEGSQAMLESLERDNLFVVALDDVREWYRYHQLFADLLRTRLQETTPASLPELHRRASIWYEEHDLILEAFHHARLASDLERSIHLIEQHTYALAFGGPAHATVNWLHSVLAFLYTLPDECIETHPRLCLSQVLLLLLTGQVPEALRRLEVAKQVASRVASGSALQVLLTEAAVFHAYIVFLQGDLASSVALAEQVANQLDGAPADVRDTMRLLAAHRALVSGDARHVRGEYENRLIPAREVRSTMMSMEVFLQQTSLLLQARLFQLQGSFRQAAAVYEHMVQVPGDPQGTLLHPGSYFGLGELFYFRNDLDMAHRLLEQGRAALRGPLALAGDAITRGYTTLARLYQVRQQHDQALAIVDELVELATTRHFAQEPLAAASACRAQVELMEGHLAAAVSWAHASGLSAANDLVYPREQEYLIFARVRIAQGRLDPAGPYLAEALRLLERLRADAERSARVGSLLDILAVQALAQFAAEPYGHRILSTLEQVLRLAEPEGAIRPFLDEGEPMAALLRQAHDRGIASAYVARLLSAGGKQTTAAPFDVLPRVEALTERERAVFQLLVRGLSNAEIAQELIITVGTVKRHLNSIYGKLGVKSRAQAIARAQTLQLR